MEINKKLNLKKEAAIISEYFSPRIISEVNDQYVKLAKIKGENIPWHNHKDEDELFYIIEGSLLMEIENEPSFEMKTGDLFVVKKGINHRVSSVNECLIMLIESKSTQHTGNVVSDVTKNIDQQKY